MDLNLSSSTNPTETDDRLCATHAERTRPDPLSSLRVVPPSGDSNAEFGELRHKWPACLADAHPMARPQASHDRCEGPCEAEPPLSASAEKTGPARGGTALALPKCQTPRLKQINLRLTTKDRRPTGRFSSLAADLRSRLSGSRAAREWRFRKPNRRDSQCVPI